MSYCGEHIVVNGDLERKTAVTLFCRSWGCGHCAETRRAGLIAEAIGGSPNVFLTLTLRRSQAATPEDGARQLTRAWRLVRLRIMRKYGWRKLPFIAVFEPHQSGWPHLHILLRSAFIDVGFVSDAMSELVNSPVVYITKIDSKGRVAGYCAKYCGKGAAKFGTCRRYWSSRDYDTRATPEHLDKTRAKQSWVMLKYRLWLWCRDWSERGWSIEQVTPYKARARAPPCTAERASEKVKEAP